MSGSETADWTLPSPSRNTAPSRIRMRLARTRPPGFKSPLGKAGFAPVPVIGTLARRLGSSRSSGVSPKSVAESRAEPTTSRPRMAGRDFPSATDGCNRATSSEIAGLDTGRQTTGPLGGNSPSMSPWRSTCWAKPLFATTTPAATNPIPRRTRGPSIFMPIVSADPGRVTIPNMTAT